MRKLTNIYIYNFHDKKLNNKSRLSYIYDSDNFIK